MTLKTYEQFINESYELVEADSKQLNSKREIERYEAALKRQGYTKTVDGSNDEGYVHTWTKGSDSIEVSVDVAAEGRRGVTGYAQRKTK